MIKRYKRIKMSRLKNRVSKTGLMLKYWIRMSKRGDYWHTHQGMGRMFVPGQLAGYFNDLSGKTNWQGEEDHRSIPITTYNQKKIYFPTTIIQKALGHWDLYLISQTASEKETHLERVLATADWLTEVQDENGGWILWPLIGRQYKSPYSGMSQGQGMSLLTRAYSVTGRSEYIISAKRAFIIMQKSIDEGGIQRLHKGHKVLEEGPSDNISGVLNGSIFAIFGIYDLVHFYGTSDEHQTLNTLVSDLVACLPEFDAKFWSYYDLEKNMASPFYNDLHVAQMLALELAFPNYSGQIAVYRKRFENYSRSPIKKSAAIITKLIQKLINPPEGVLQ